MKCFCAPFIAVGLLFSCSIYGSERGDSNSLKGPYIGQKPPGLTPKVFEPNKRTSQYRDWGGGFTPDMNAYYFSRWFKNGKSKRFVYERINDEWKLSEVDERFSPNMSPDGKTMFSGTQYIELNKDGWSQPKSLGPMFEDYRIMRLTASRKGMYVFDEATRTGDGLLRYSRLINGKRQNPKPFGENINTGKWTAHPFIAPDESYIIWDSEREGGYGSSDMYISFRQPDGSYGKAINFGDTINTEGEDGGGSVTPDGKYLFYCRRCSPPNFDIMWVDAKIIDELKASQ